jgi:hypothetical protein
VLCKLLLLSRRGAGLSAGLIPPLRQPKTRPPSNSGGFFHLPRKPLIERTHRRNIPMSIETESRIPRINEPAPDFHAKSTHGAIKLSDYTSKGKYVLLFSHPSDFTPVCTTEFIEFARRHHLT